eukprot:4728022-Prymnesium_polylepis.2
MHPRPRVRGADPALVRHRDTLDTQDSRGTYTGALRLALYAHQNHQKASRGAIISNCASTPLTSSGAMKSGANGTRTDVHTIARSSCEWRRGAGTPTRRASSFSSVQMGACDPHGARAQPRVARAWVRQDVGRGS